MKNDITDITAVMLDLDGTVFDSVELWHEIDNIFLGKRGIVPSYEYKHGIAALGFTASAYYTIDFYKLSDTPEQLMNEWNELAAKAYAEDIKLLDGAREYIEKCRADGKIITAVTSLHRSFAESCMKNNGIFDMFDKIFTADETGLAKASPDIYIHAAKTVGADSYRCMAFDDVAAAIISAKRAGMTTVAMDGKMLDRNAVKDYADFIVKGWNDAPNI